MAVTIHSSPQLYTPSDNPITWTFSSNQTGQANFSYIIEAYVNGVLDSRHEIFPEVGARAHFDMQDIMQRFTPVATTTQTTVVKDAANYATCFIIIRERYGATPAYGASATATTIRAFKAALSKEEFANWNYLVYFPSTDPDKGKFMTTSPNTLRLNPDNDNFVSIITNGGTDAFIVFKLFEADGTSIPGADIPIPDSPLRIAQINLKSSLLIAETIIPQEFFDAADYMEYFINIDGGDPVTEIKRVYFDRSDCGEPTHFVWLNKFGGFDCFNFSHNRIYSGSIESYTYEKQFGEWQGTSFVYDPNNSGVIDYLKRGLKRMTAVSGFIHQDQQNFLVQSMYMSPLCYILDDEYIRVRVEATEYTLQQDNFEEEYTEEVTVSFPNYQLSQRL